METRDFIAAEKAWERSKLNYYLNDGCDFGCIDRALLDDPNVDQDLIECDCDDYAEQSRYAYEESRAEDFIEGRDFY
jgi:hypothetical protein